MNYRLLVFEKLQGLPGKNVQLDGELLSTGSVICENITLQFGKVLVMTLLSSSKNFLEMKWFVPFI